MSSRRANVAWISAVVGWTLALGVGCSAGKDGGGTYIPSASGGSVSPSNGGDSGGKQNSDGSSTKKGEGGSSEDSGGTSNKSSKGGSSSSSKGGSSQGGSSQGDSSQGGSSQGGSSQGGSSQGGSSQGGSSKGGSSKGGSSQGSGTKGGSSAVGGTSSGANTNSSKGGTSSSSSSSTSTQTTPSSNCASVSKGDVAMSASSGTFEGTLSVELSTKIADAEIRYTTDGSEPTASSTVYSSALSLTKTTRLRAAAFVNGSINGIASTSLYVARAAGVAQAHDIPVIVLDSYGSGALPSDYQKERPFVDVAFLAFEPSGGTVTIGNTPTVASLAAFHVRGNSSSMFDKKPYRLELRAENGADRDCPMFGMPAESDWALISPHADKTLIHNNFVYDLGRAMGMQVPRAKLAEVYVNVDDSPLTADDYQGVYQIVETIKNQKDRLDLKQLDETDTTEPDITGGYIFKTEWMLKPDDGEATIACPDGTTKPWNYLLLVDPSPVATEQMNYLVNHLLGFHNALHGSNPADANSGYPSYIEVRSFIDTVIVNELTRSLDAYARSQYYYKDRGQKINAGPLWDFDLIAGSGISTTYANLSDVGWQYESNAPRLGGTTTTGGGIGGGMGGGASVDWIPVLIADATFKAQLITRWKELRQGILSDSGIASRIDDVSNDLSAAAGRNFAKWPILSTKTVSPFETPTAATWAEQITYMKDWLKKRAAWLDTQWT